MKAPTTPSPIGDSAVPAARALTAVGGWLRPTGSRARDRRRRRLAGVLEGLAVGLSFRASCAGAGVNYSSWCRWKASGPESAELEVAVARAYEIGTQHLEELALARVESGDHRADRLLELLLKARRPHVYSEKRDVRIAGTIEERKVLVLPAVEAEVLAVEEARAIDAE